MLMRQETSQDGKISLELSFADLAAKYFSVKELVLSKGYSDEIEWQSSLCFDDLDESSFLEELSWVILSSGMRESVIRKHFGNISKCFFYWSSSKIIIKNKKDCFNNAICYFNNKSKISSIIFAANILSELNFNDFKVSIIKDPISVLQQFPHIGPTTVYHLAKNIGIQVAKPDRHLVRMANAAGYSDVQLFCRTISQLSGDSIPVVDIVLWRFATIEKDYLIF